MLYVHPTTGCEVDFYSELPESLVMFVSIITPGYYWF